MKYNHALEEKKFNKRWEMLAKEYKEAGMSEEVMQQMWEFDRKEFNSNRVFCIHNQYMELAVKKDGELLEERKSLIGKKYIDNFTTEISSLSTSSRYGWMDEIENEMLFKVIRELKQEDIELLTLFVFDGYTVVEIAKIQGVSHQFISKKITRLKKILKNFKKGLRIDAF